MSTIEAALNELGNDFAELGVRDRLTLLLEIADELPVLPPRSFRAR